MLQKKEYEYFLGIKNNPCHTGNLPFGIVAQCQICIGPRAGSNKQSEFLWVDTCYDIVKDNLNIIQEMILEGNSRKEISKFLRTKVNLPS